MHVSAVLNIMKVTSSSSFVKRLQSMIFVIMIIFVIQVASVTDAADGNGDYDVDALDDTSVERELDVFQQDHQDKLAQVKHVETSSNNRELFSGKLFFLSFLFGGNNKQAEPCPSPAPAPPPTPCNESPTPPPTNAPTPSPVASPTGGGGGGGGSSPTSTTIDWVLSAASGSCTTTCINAGGVCGTDQVTLMNAVNTADFVNFVASQVGQTCGNFFSCTLSTCPGKNGGVCGFQTGNAATCSDTENNVERFCCCGTNCPTA